MGIRRLRRENLFAQHSQALDDFLSLAVEGKAARTEILEKTYEDAIKLGLHQPGQENVLEKLKDIAQGHLRFAVEERQRLNDLARELESAKEGKQQLTEETSELWKIIESLPEQQQLAIQLRFFESLSFKDIAERIGIREAAVAALIRRALAAVREKLHPQLADPEGVDSNDLSLGCDMWVDVGEASVEDIQELFQSLSDLNRALGGKGLVFIADKDGASVMEGVS